MTKQFLLVVNGLPGTGKTTLARKLGKDLDVPQMGKDDLKEFLFDRFGVGDREWSRTLGMAASDMLYPLMDDMLSKRQSMIIESAFDHKFTKDRMGALVQKHSVACLEVYTETEEQERQRRFIERNESGERHAGHIDHVNYNVADEGDKEKYAPLAIGKVRTVDTNHFGEPEYKELLHEVVAFIDT